MKTAIQPATLAIALLAVAGCAHCPLCGGEWNPSKHQVTLSEAHIPITQTLTGKVSCLERVTMLPTFELRIRLVAASTTVAPSTILAEETIRNFREFPVTFSLTYDSARLTGSGSYALVAELLSQGTTLFATDTQYKISAGTPAPTPIEMVIVRVK